VRVDPGNDPGRDEYGLPPVDIKIPDDARDLDRDVHAYYRELRARRRRMRVRRLAGPLTRHGMIMPLVAACLAVTLLTGTLLTVLAGRQVPLLSGPAAATRAAQTRAPRTPSSTPPQAPSSPAPSPAGQGRQLPSVPNIPVTLGSRHVGLRSLVPAVLAWVPAGCHCGTVLTQLASQAAAADVPIYFVGTAAAVGELRALASQAGPGYPQRVITDPTGALAVYQPVGVTAIFVHPGGAVERRDVVRNLDKVAALPSRTRQFKARLRVLAPSSQASEAS
jgi:hypothetical protein